MLRSAWLVPLAVLALCAGCDTAKIEVIDTAMTTTDTNPDTGASVTDTGSATDVEAEVSERDAGSLDMGGTDTADDVAADTTTDDVAADTAIDGTTGDAGEDAEVAQDIGEPDAGPGPVVDFTLVDLSETSDTTGLEVSPSDYTGTVTGWYFTHAT